jgi:hypothetical protein
MFAWYHNALVCFAYLLDVSSGTDMGDPGLDFGKSKWFTRGWTLQELLAPKAVVFYSREWKILGTKSTLKR